jgi:penicillin-binding protein 1A
MRLVIHRRWPLIVLAGLSLAAMVAGIGLGYFLKPDMPNVRALEDYRPPEMSRLFSADDSLLATFAVQRRMLISYDEIPLVFRQALLATEDKNFYSHTGIDFKGILRAATRDLLSFKLAQGASTLTQQLARNLFLTSEKTVRRKVMEVLLALEIERQYSKQEILRFYCNQIYTGHGRYGIEAASRFYFAKPARELSRSEAATLAGLLQRPESLSPIKNPERAKRRRDFVLSRLFEEGYITAHEAEVARLEPIVTASRGGIQNPAPYFVEDVRRWLQQRYGSTILYKGGLEVRSTLDPVLQQIATTSLDYGLRSLDKRQGFRGVQQRLPDGEDPGQWQAPSWTSPIETGKVYDGLVLSADAQHAVVRVADVEGSLGPDEIAWTKIKNPGELLRAGDLIDVRVIELDDAGVATLSLEQEPLVEAALIALDPATGAVKALIGGFDFGRSEWDRASQSDRQTGSAFKPFVYAAALAQGWTLADTILDVPTVFLDPRNPEPYQPENYGHKYYRKVTLRKALERSANIATVKLLDRIGYDAVIDIAHRLGINSDLQPFPSLALGSFGVTLLELTSAYGTFANQGVNVEPHLVDLVLNSDGEIIDRIQPRVIDSVTPQIAYLMNKVLGGVITDGTGRAASSLGHHLAGKTGTTDDNTDAWFIGYSPTLAVGVWVGFDEPRSLGSRETGAQAALPIWRSFMEGALKNMPDIDFPRPPELTIVSIDRVSGLKANHRADCDQVISEFFVAGTEPTTYCSTQEHRLHELPYSFQKFDLNEQGALMIPSDELDRILNTELDVFLIENGKRIEAHLPTGILSVPLEILAPRGIRPIPERLKEKFDTESWVGLDGLPAEIVWLGRQRDRKSP